MLVIEGVLGISTGFTALLPANVVLRKCMLGFHFGQLLKIRDAYSVAAWTDLYGHTYRMDYSSALGRYEGC